MFVTYELKMYCNNYYLNHVQTLFYFTHTLHYEQ